MPPVPKRRWLGVLVLALVVALAACGDEGDDRSGGGARSGPAATAMPDAANSVDEGAGDDSGTGETGGGEGSSEGGDGGDPNARFNLIASPDNGECSYVPNGHLSGADQLTVHFYFLIIGGNPPDVPAVSVTGQSDSGLSTSYSSGPHNQAVSSAQFALRDGDFGRTHTLTLTVDASNQVSETDESDNRVRVTVQLPSPRPSSTIDPLPCRLERAL